MSRIHIKMLAETALDHLKKNIDVITNKIINNDDNSWIFHEFPQPMFIEKKPDFEDFDLTPNPESEDKEIDFDNSIKLYEAFKNLPRYILCDERFWLWLHFDKGALKFRGEFSSTYKV